MTENFRLWAVMSGLMMLVIIVLCLILKIKEKIELRIFKKIYNKAKANGTFEVDYPTMSGIWSVDKKIYILLKERNREIKTAYNKALEKNNLIDEPKEEI